MTLRTTAQEPPGGRSTIARTTFLVMALTALAIAAAADVAVAEHPDFGRHLVDGRGHTIYVFTEDSPFTSTCVEGCAEVWEPVSFEGLVPSGTGVDVVLLGSTVRPDGRTQVTYGGLPLYTFTGDGAPGDALGVGADGTWFAIGRDASLIGEAAAGATDDDAAEALTADELFAAGRELFPLYCAGCHEADGRGSIGPNLRDNARLADDAFMARQIRDGVSEMPGFGEVLTDEQLAAVATFVRNTWGNSFGPMAPEQFRR